MGKRQLNLQEVNTQIEFAKRSYEAFQSALASDDKANVFFHLHHFVIHAAYISKILTPKDGTARQSVLANFVDLSGIDFRQFRDLRNDLEHFDERLDTWVEKYYGYPVFDMNIATGAKGFPAEVSLRALVGDIYKFSGKEYNIAEIFSSILEIESRLPTLRWDTPD